MLAVCRCPARASRALASVLMSLLMVQAATLRAQNEAAPVEPHRLVTQMSEALQTLNYEGTFVHVRNGHVESMHILHANDGRGELERMMSLTGEAREIIRNHSHVTCIFPDSQSVVVTNSKPRSALPEIDASLVDNPQYEITLGEPDRVAGYMTHVVDLAPRDAMRYGYRFWIDKTTQMLLRSMLLDADGQSLEEVMFVAIEFLDDIPLERFDVTVTKDQITWSEPLNEDAGAGSSGLKNAGFDGASAPDRVQFEQLPPGYREVSETYRAMPINDGPVSHVMLSDGVASVSVYVEHVNKSAQQPGALGASSMGAMSAYGESRPDALITAVGEVPEITVRKIAQSVRIAQ